MIDDSTVCGRWWSSTQVGGLNYSWVVAANVEAVRVLASRHRSSFLLAKVDWSMTLHGWYGCAVRIYFWWPKRRREYPVCIFQGHERKWLESKEIWRPQVMIWLVVWSQSCSLWEGVAWVPGRRQKYLPQSRFWSIFTNGIVWSEKTSLWWVKFQKWYADSGPRGW